MAEEKKAAGAIEKENEERLARQKFETPEAIETQDAEVPFESVPERRELEKPSGDSGEKDRGEKAGAGIAAPIVGQSSAWRDQEKKIEKILEKDLEKIYVSLTPEKKQEFRTEGEKTAKKIVVLMNEAKVKTGKIIALIKKWLSLLPGMNKFFLEQETKLKTDEIMKLGRNSGSNY